jgi:predicted RNA-binding Zn-ribbon protein involved in translation (DUF1610 family)
MCPLEYNTREYAALMTYSRLGPWFTAGYSSGSCSDCGEDITEGDTIRADGQGGYLCEECGAEGEE